MSDFPLVSVVLAVFNGEKFLRDQLNSLVSQSYLNIEIIAVDDASTDASLSILQEFAQRYGNILLAPLAINGGQVAALETGLRLAQGDFVAISDQDDIWVAEKIARLLTAIHDAAAIFSESLLIDDNGCSLNKQLLKDFVRISPAPILRDPIAIVAKNIASGHALMFRRELVSILLPFAKDIMYDHQIAIVSAATNGLRYVNDPLVLHRQHSQNSTNKLVNKEASRYSKAQLYARRQGKAKMFYKALNFVMNLRLQNKIQSDLFSYRIFDQVLKLNDVAGRPGFFAFCGRLFFLLRNCARLFHSAGAKKKIQKSWRLAVDGCYE